MNTLIQLFAAAFRIGGALAGVTAVFLISDATLIEAIAAVGLDGSVSPAMARMAAHAAFGALGFIIASQIAALILRGPSIPAGTRKEAAESVPRLRRHLIEGEKPAGSAMPRYLDPDPAPTKPVAVSFKELGLEHPQPDEYPAPGGERGEQNGDFPLRERQDRPDSAGSASDEWDDLSPAPERSRPSDPTETGSSAAPQPAPEPPQAPETWAAEAQPEPEQRHSSGETRSAPPETVREPDVALPTEWPSSPADSASSDWTEAGGADDDIFEPWPDARPAQEAPAPVPVPTPSAAPVAAGSSEPVAAWSEPVTPTPASRRAVEADFAPSQERPAVTAAAPNFALPAAGGGSDWYDGAGDEEEDADDDGAGYGSLADIGLGKSHAPRAQAGQRGEAGLPPALYSAPGATSLVPHGKPQDFRLREALSELQRLDRSQA